MNREIIIMTIKCMKEAYEMDLDDTELMSKTATLREIALTNRNNLNTILRLLDAHFKYVEEQNDIKQKINKNEDSSNRK